MRIWLLLGLLLSALALLACSRSHSVGAPSKQPRVVNVTLGKYYIKLEPPEVPAGRVLLEVANAGGLVHEAEVLRLPSEFELDEMEEIAPGEGGSMNLQVEPGEYEIVCAMVERLPNGQVANH